MIRIFLVIFMILPLTEMSYAHEQNDTELLNKDTGEVIQNLIDRLDTQNKKIDNQKKVINKLSLKLDSTLYHFFGNKITHNSNEVITKNNKYTLTKIYLPFNDYFNQGSTPVGFIEQSSEKIILATGGGGFIL